MTFTPQVLTQTDNNNSINTSSDVSFNGISTITTGYNTLILTVNSTTDSLAGGIQIQFSDNNTTWITPYTDTYFSTNVFTKNYLIIKKYYRIIYNNSLSGTFTITSRLSSQLDSSITQNTSISVFDNNVQNTLDAFSRLRVSFPTTILDIRFPGQTDGSANFLKNNLQICSDSSGSYVGTYGDSQLIVDASGVGYYISQSRNYCVYQPGKSLLFMASGILDPSNNNFTTRIGYFDNMDPSTNFPLIVRNGLYFECSGGIISVNIKNNSTTQINQIDWNIDKLNGTGLSGLTLDFSKTQLFVIDMEWLGVGRIRFGFYVYGKIQYCHQVTNINSLTQPYTNSINLPICYSIHNSTVGGGTSNSFKQICSTVISEGGYAPLGRPFSVSTVLSTTASPNTETPVLFLRGNITNTNYNHQNIIPKSVSIISSSTNDLILYKLVLFLAGTYTVTEPTWVNVDSSYSVAQYGNNPAPSTLLYSSTNGIVLDEGYVYGRGTNSFVVLGDVFTSQVLQITSNIINQSDILVLTATFVTSGGSSTNVYGTLAWQELY